ncbi:hypothetical protein GCM10027340_22480 [Marinomonas epiphytica]
MNFVAIRREFDFRSIEMGRWVTSEERDRAAPKFYQALTDLKRVLNVPYEVISLRGQLGIQYGKGGQLGVSAHYTPATRQLALAKNAGAGSLAHEWFHAFDHHMGSKMFATISDKEFASFAWINNAVPYPHPLNTLLGHCFQTILLDDAGERPSELFMLAKQVDGQLNSYYYAKPEEMAARCFEAFIEDALPNSQFLVKGTRASQEAQFGLYPKGKNREAINLAFADYFAHLGSALGKAPNID